MHHDCTQNPIQKIRKSGFDLSNPSARRARKNLISVNDSYPKKHLGKNNRGH